MSVITSILLYVFIFVMSALIVGYGYRTKSGVIQVIGLLLPVVLGGLRYNVGLDYSTYLNAYADIINPQAVDRYIGTSNLEHSFYIISYLSHYLFSSPIAVYFFYSAITVGAFYRALTLMKPKKVAVALFFFYSIFFLNSFNIMRQGAAVSLGCLAVIHYLKGNRLKAIIYFLLAVALHTSALLLVFYILVERLIERNDIVKKKKNFIGIFIITIIISMTIAIAGLKLPAISTLIYTATGRIGDFNPGLSVGTVFKYIVCLACLCLVVKVWDSFNNQQKRLSLFMALGTIVYSLGLVYNEAARFGIYLVALMPILFSVVYDKLTLLGSKKMLIVNVSLILVCITYVVAVHVATGEGVQYKYQNVLTSTDYKQQILGLGI